MVTLDNSQPVSIELRLQFVSKCSDTSMCTSNMTNTDVFMNSPHSTLFFQSRCHTKICIYYAYIKVVSVLENIPKGT